MHGSLRGRSRTTPRAAHGRRQSSCGCRTGTEAESRRVPLEARQGPESVVSSDARAVPGVGAPQYARFLAELSAGRAWPFPKDPIETHREQQHDPQDDRLPERRDAQKVKAVVEAPDDQSTEQGS